MIDYTAVRASFETYLDSSFSTLPIVFENEEVPTEEPDSETYIEHIALVDQDVSSSPLGMGEDPHLVEGVVVVQIYTRVGSGTKVAREVASEIITLMRSYPDSINFMEPEFRSIGEVENAHLYQHSLSLPYQYVYGQND